MNNSLNPCFSGICSFIVNVKFSKKLNLEVLILVLVEYVLLLLFPNTKSGMRRCLNPCFSGICSFIVTVEELTKAAAKES